MSVNAKTPIIPARDIAITDSATITAAVISVERRSESGLVNPVVGLEARLECRNPGARDYDTYFLSRLVGECAWVIDTHIGPNGFPHFSHGFGVRYLNLTGVPLPLDALLDEAARSSGLVTDLGPDIPLAFAGTSQHHNDA